MALFSRRKKSADDVVADPTEADATVSADETDGSAPESEDAATVDPKDATGTASEPSSAPGPRAASDAEASTPAEEAAPAVGISVQAFRGVGAQAGPEVSLPDPHAGPVSAAESTAPVAPTFGGAPAPRPADASTERRLPLAPALPPEQTETVPGMKDNVLLREALAQIEQGATNEQLLGVLRQALQAHLYIRVNGDARAQISEGKPLSVAVVRDGDRQFMLAFSSAGAVRDSVQLEKDPTATSAVAQPVTSVLQQVVAGDFAGLIVDNASAPHRVVFPTELLEKALEQADVEMTVKSLLAQPREQDTAAKLGQALATKRMWVAVNDGTGTGQPGIAEAQTADGKRFLQLFSHPLEVLALGRGDRPLPFDPEQLAKLLAGHPEMAGVILDPAGPTLLVERDALAPVLVLAVDLGD
ncbi:SseB family protein [Microbacterium hydrocarbonoxydans]|uniref:SseB family protein n=1 Tax=Microbacterium hydrocarbonoxydans TaxID=273678 RepID=UPI00203B55E5|nr:SseB family protein [Microbacterium hydrocarbonoxydans]MCM3779583.1 SseB family protein [Microbacterium hydrocarbonoxydans]